MKSIELKYPVIVRERQGRFDHSKIFRPPGVETPGGRAGTRIFQYQAVEHSPEGYTSIYPKTYDRLPRRPQSIALYHRSGNRA
ncbi:MAG: hypothetical protein OMM_14833 [Candidatus Magnetoglobus multicellularis str. Araruama]|uniref:Uncharacterized protein n=1 Tax=Candidatus Magnetoglobus multicellularis str. Araruama TaxID=890399 RepID=A0A1V1NR78_9BACT|nr:MAG: hypothetical protein OMM_14833 [Candidatus Magnetoglobus multicellularis str. Araruama]